MAPKNERFEMRLDEEVLERVDRWRATLADVPSRAEAMRRLVEMGLLTATSRGTVKLSDGEKLLAIMLRDVYKKLDLDHGEIDPDFVADVIWGGHYWALNWELTGLFHDMDTQHEVGEVVDVLDLWTFVERGYGKLSKKDKERVEKEAHPFGTHVVFTGFDGNNETEHMSIARFLIEKMDRFTNFKGRELNSHMPSLGTYRRMLAVFEPMRPGLAGGDLNVSQIIQILKENLYPEHRRPTAA